MNAIKLRKGKINVAEATTIFTALTKFQYVLYIKVIINNEKTNTK